MNNSEDNSNPLEVQENEITTDEIETNSEIKPSETVEQPTSTSTPELLDSKINEIIQPEVDEEVIFPTYTLYRNKNRENEVLKYQPGDLITLVLRNTGTSKSTTIEMFDARDQSRYLGRSGGHTHEWTTRIQRTTILGNWRFTAQGPFIDENNLFSIDIPFEIVEYIPEDVPVVVKEVVVDEPSYEDLINFAISEKVNIPVIEIKGVGPSFQKKMNDSAIYHFHEILQSEAEEIAIQTSINQLKIEMWVAFVAKVLENRDHELVLKYSPLGKAKGKGGAKPSTIKGIGPVTETKLISAGYDKVELIARASEDDLSSSMNVTVNKAKTWIKNANEFLSEETEEIDIVKTSAPVAAEVGGSASPSAIKGVGPATSKKLVEGGLNSVKEVAEARLDILIEILGSEKRATKIQLGAQTLMS